MSDADSFERILARLRSAAASRLHEYPPDALEQLLSDARTLAELLERERSRQFDDQVAGLIRQADKIQRRLPAHPRTRRSFVGWIITLRVGSRVFSFTR